MKREHYEPVTAAELTLLGMTPKEVTEQLAINDRARKAAEPFKRFEAALRGAIDDVRYSRR